MPRDGTYPADKPFVLTVPADGKAGEYVIKLTGQQDNLLASRMPMTDLPFEVYVGCGFSLGYAGQGEERKVMFRVPACNPGRDLLSYKTEYDGELTEKKQAVSAGRINRCRLINTLY